MTKKRNIKVSAIIPVYKADKELESLLSYLSCDSTADEVIIIETRSKTSIAAMARKYGARVIRIDKRSFDHGYVRTLGGRKAKGDILVYMTQDSMPANKISVKNLIKPMLEDDKNVASYGRQLPCSGASPFAAHLRLFNYPKIHEVKSFNDRKKKGLKTAFISNSFSAYKKSALKEIGWFKKGLQLGEDFYAGARLLEKGFRISYAADAEVYHSHNYTVAQEFRRYFDIGVFHRKEYWLIKTFGLAETEGVKFVFSETGYLIRTGKFYLIPQSLVRAIIKYIGYRLGYIYNILPKALIKKCSMGNSREA